MVMEIKPIPGQPGLFKDLSGHSWTSTFAGPMFHAPFGNKSRGGLGAMALSKEYVAKSRPTLVTQQDIPEGQVPGITLTVYIPLKSEAIPQPTLDTVFRSLFSQLGYDVSASSIDLTPVAYQWKYDAETKVWEASPVAGPQTWVKRASSPVLIPGSGTPPANALDNAPKAVETYKVLLRSKDLSLSPARLDALLTAARVAARDKGWDKSVGWEAIWAADVHGVTAPIVPEKPSTSLAWLGLVAVGWMAVTAMRGKVST